MTAPTFPIADAAYNTCHSFYKTCSEIETKRNQLFEQRTLDKKIAYWAVTAFAWIAMIAVPSCVALAAINFSLAYLALAAVAAAALYGLGILRGRFNTFSANEEPCFKQF